MAVDPGLKRGGMIVQLVDSSSIGGIESHMAALTMALRQRGADAKIVLLEAHGDNPWLAQLAAKGVPLQVLPSKVLTSKVVPGGFGPLLSMLRRERPAILHTHGYKAGIMGRLAAQIAGVPVVSTFHAGERGAFPVSLYQAIDGLTACLATRIAVNREIAAGLPFGAHVIRNFIVMPTMGPRREKRGIVGFVGRLSHEKGPDLFCEIAEMSGSNLEFHIFGDGPMRAELEARHGARVRFRGLQTDMDSVWREISLLMMPSRAEGMPMAALEALAHGIPVAAARVGALPDLLGEGGAGWLFEPGDVVEAARAVTLWAELPGTERNRMALHCRKLAETRFGPAEPLAELLAIYGRLAPPLLMVA